VFRAGFKRKFLTQMNANRNDIRKPTADAPTLGNWEIATGDPFICVRLRLSPIRVHLL
jgi:hypothetical protein